MRRVQRALKLARLLIFMLEIFIDEAINCFVASLRQNGGKKTKPKVE